MSQLIGELLETARRPPSGEGCNVERMLEVVVRSMGADIAATESADHAQSASTGGGERSPRAPGAAEPDPEQHQISREQCAGDSYPGGAG